MKQYNKLVRDKIPDIIQKNGQMCNFEYIEGERLKTELFNKLEEEVKELRESGGNIEEFIDVVEVLAAIGDLINLGDTDLDTNEVFNAAMQKREEKGGFEKGCFLIEADEYFPIL